MSFGLRRLTLILLLLLVNGCASTVAAPANTPSPVPRATAPSTPPATATAPLSPRPASTRTALPPTPASATGTQFSVQAALAHSRQLASVIGARPSTSPAMHQAANYIYDQLRSYGYQVSAHRFQMPAYQAHEVIVQVAGNATNIPASALQYSSSDEITAEVLDAGPGRREDFQGKKFTGKIALVKRGGLLIADKAANAAAAGVAALVIDNSSGGPFFANTRPGTNLLAVSIGDQDGRFLRSLLGKDTVRVRVKVVGTTQDGEGINVVAQGPQPAGRTILLGAHYDSVPVGPGANDNASGTSLILDVARALAAAGQANRVTVVAFAGEEEGLLGSRAYVANLRPSDRGMIAAMLNFDMVAKGKPLSIGYAGGGDAPPHAEVTVDIARANGVPTVSGEAAPDSDHWPFAQAGIPSVYFDTGIDAYYHTADDTFDKLEPDTFSRSGVVALATAQRLVAGLK